MDEETKDSLLLGELAMEYALVPFTPERVKVALAAAGKAMA